MWKNNAEQTTSHGGATRRKAYCRKDGETRLKQMHGSEKVQTLRKRKKKEKIPSDVFRGFSKLGHDEPLSEGRTNASSLISALAFQPSVAPTVYTSTTSTEHTTQHRYWK